MTSRQEQSSGVRSTPQFGHRRSTSLAASRAMRGNAQDGTQPEMLLRRELWRRGRRYRLHDRRLPGRPDLVFRTARVVLFCDGDFWHGRDWAQRRERLQQGANADYWVSKIEANMARDRRNEMLLKQAGWSVMRFWESEIRADVAAVASAVETGLARAKGEGT